MDGYDFGPHKVTSRIRVLAAAASTSYVTTPFSLADAVGRKSEGITVYRRAQGRAYTILGGKPIPSDSDHLVTHLGLAHSNEISTYIHNEVATRKLVLPGQISMQLEQLYEPHAAICDHPRNTYFEPQEFLLQAGYRLTPPHIDHGQVFALLPSYCVHAIKVWVSVPFRNLKSLTSTMDPASFTWLADHPHASVVVQEPGDIVYLPPLVCHSVMVGYKQDTHEENKWCVLGGSVFIQASDVYESYMYATRATVGARKNTPASWQRVLTPFRELRGYRQLTFTAEKTRFFRCLSTDPRYNMRGSADSAKAGWQQIKTKKKAVKAWVIRMKEARESKRKAALTTI